MALRSLSIASLSLLLLTLTISAQKQQPPKTPPPQNDRFEKAHEGLFGAKPSKAEEASRLTEAVSKLMPGSGSPGAAIPRKNFVDDHIFGRIQRDAIPHAPLAGDEEFIRRVYLDAIGLPPSPDAVREFMANTDPLKRDKLIDSLIGTEEFAEQWAWFWGDLFRTRPESFQHWVKQWLKVDRPYNEVFYDIVTVTAKHHDMIPAAGFYEGANYSASRAPTPTDADNYYLFNRLDFIDEVAVDIGRIFLGINMDCISCHDGAGHLETINLYLSNRTREEFHRQAAFFGKLRSIIGYSDRALNISNEHTIMDDLGPGYKTDNDAPWHTTAETRFPRDGKAYEPAFILTGEKPRPGENPRKALGRIVPNHTQFARAAANLIWTKLMVVGFVETYDGFDLARLDPKNPPPKPWTVQLTNPELLEALARDFRDHNYSTHRLMKTIMKSNAYQLSTYFPGEWKQEYTPYYARRFVRVLTGPELADTIAKATDRPYNLQLAGQEVGRVKQLSNPRSLRSGEGTALGTLMQGFFQSTRETPAFYGNQASPLQAMLMMASPVVNSRVRAEKGSRVDNLLQSGKSDSEVIEELFLATLSRRPTLEETEVARHLMEKDRKAGLENVQWALLNSAEFILNH
ncbi:MAG: DUF1549 domain-containing protein [Acidobacteria bacterium]|nr:DUF1549 domain-containing protein [Acidobacteriota bacterium]